MIDRPTMLGSALARLHSSAKVLQLSSVYLSLQQGHQVPFPEPSTLLAPMPASSHPLPHAAEAARVALAQANADLNLLLNNPNVNPQLQGAAQIAIADAARMAAQEHLLPLNIVEASPDGQWLAVGADQLAVVLVPAGAG